MNLSFERIALSVCALSLSILSLHTVTAHADAQTADPAKTFDEITVRRLKVIDASGATRLLLTGKPIVEGTIDGKTMPRIGGPREAAGLIFYNDQGDEQGGLTYAGTNGEQEQSLTFDAWRQDQALEIQHGDNRTGSDSYIAGSDMPKASVYDAAVKFHDALASAKTDDERNAIKRRFRQDGKFGRRRFLVGETNGNSDVTLDDAQGRPRLQLRVTREGVASIAFINADGRLIRSISADQR